MKTQSEEVSCPGASASSWLQRHWCIAVKLELAWKQIDNVSWVVAYDAPPLRALEHLQMSLQVGPHMILPQQHASHVTKALVFCPGASVPELKSREETGHMMTLH